VLKGRFAPKRSFSFQDGWLEAKTFPATKPNIGFPAFIAPVVLIYPLRYGSADITST